MVGNTNFSLTLSWMLCVTILYLKGEKVRQLTHEKLEASIAAQNWIHEAAVRGGKMAVACRDRGVVLFNLR